MLNFASRYNLVPRLLKVASLFYFDLSFGSWQQVEELQIGFTPDVMLEI